MVSNCFGLCNKRTDEPADQKEQLSTSDLSERLFAQVFDDPATKQEARMGRRRAMLRAVFAEFIGTIFFFLPIFGVLFNNYTEGYDGAFNRMSAGIVAGMTLVCMIMCFSSLSGAIFNPAITFSLWIVGKMSNRKCIFFMIAQMAGSIACMFFLYATFPTISQDAWKSCVMSPSAGASSWNVFFTEFVCTFILTYCAFAMAFEEAEDLKSKTMSFQAVEASDGLMVYGSTPQSKVGFAPFAIGFLVFGLSQFGGGSGTAMNPVRMFGPAIMTGIWDSWVFYVLGQFLGASFGAITAVHGPQSGERGKSKEQSNGRTRGSTVSMGRRATNAEMPTISPMVSTEV